MALITAVAGSFALAINSSIQKGETERAFRASQIDAVIKVTPPVKSEDIRLYAQRLATYGEFAIPLLTAVLTNDPDTDQGSAAERSLVQIALVSQKTNDVGRTMAIILQDNWQSYDHPVHEAALRIISAICYCEASSILASYKPESVVRDWKGVVASQEWLKHFTNTMAAARTITSQCHPGAQGNQP